MHRPALLVIDLLNDYLDRWQPGARSALVQRTNDLIYVMRAAACPVIWVRQEFEPDLSDAFSEMRQKNIRTVIRGTPGAEIDAGLAVNEADAVVVKKRYSAFFRTELDVLLEHLHPDALILAGVNTHACIRMTAIDAYQRDWPVVLAGDCIDSYDREQHDSTLKYMRDKLVTVRTNREIEAMLKGVPWHPTAQ